ncbi:MAG: hypothetical protein ACXVPN_02725 [Bacteroidia bacterium]
MYKKLIISSVLLIGMYSCGPSKAETEAKIRLQTIQDSITEAAEQQKQEELKNQLIDLKSQLAAEESKLNDVEKWQLLRSESEKTQQIADQTKIVETLKSQISDIQKQIK